MFWFLWNLVYSPICNYGVNCKELNISSRPNFLTGSALTLGFLLAELSLLVNTTKSKIHLREKEKCHEAVTCVSLLILYLQFSSSLMTVYEHSLIVLSGLTQKPSSLLNLINLHLKLKLLSSSMLICFSGAAIQFPWEWLVFRFQTVILS